MKQQSRNVFKCFDYIKTSPRYPVWIVSDCRRQTDVKYFLEKYPARVKSVRIVASDDARNSRYGVTFAFICLFNTQKF